MPDTMPTITGRSATLRRLRSITLPRIVAIGLACMGTAAGSLATPTVARAEPGTGSWTVEPHRGNLPTRCAARKPGDGMGSELIGMVRELGAIQFALASPKLAPLHGDAVEGRVLVDGTPVALREITVFDGSSVLFESAERGRLPGSLLRALEQGKRAVVEVDGHRFAFDLAGTKKAMERLSQCDMNGGRMPEADALASNSATPGRTQAETEHPIDDTGQAVVGDWIVYPSAPQIPGGCLAGRRNDEGSILLLHQERPQAGVTFGISDERFNLRDGWRGPTELVIDGRPVPFLSIRGFDKSTLLSTDAMDANDFGVRLREGRTAAFTFEGRTFQFDISGFAAAIPAFARCVAANDKTFASVLDGNRVNRVLGVTLPTDEESGTASSEADDVEEEEEETSRPGSMDALINRPRAFAQLRCSIPVINMVGLYGANEPPFSFDISINGDATANVSGTVIRPVDHEMGSSGPTVAVYRAAALYGAANKSPVSDLFTNTPEPPKDAFEKAFTEMLANPGSLVPENRLIAVSLDNNDATVADQLANGRFGDMSTHRCRRIR